ncbi:MAG TPA: class I SAM-dependent methyltransferase, partial [Polyangiaceae bacterium]|nr:class I SAM-dependent methyltransferase [Polyangiaceae bacterium]
GAEPHGRRAFELFGPNAGDAALDVGCGFGDATLELALRVGRAGSVTGIDVAPEFIELAHEHARAEPLAPIDFRVADAERFDDRTRYDYAFSRFGTMFFERPLAAFCNLRNLLRPSGRLVMTVWRPLDENPWLGVAKGVARSFLPSPEPRALSCGPGPFSLAEPTVVRELLGAAGFRQISLAPSDAATLVGRDLHEAIEFQLAIGPAGEIVREAGARAKPLMFELRAALGDALLPYVQREDGGVAIPSAAWIVHARI